MKSFRFRRLFVLLIPLAAAAAHAGKPVQTPTAPAAAEDDGKAGAASVEFGRFGTVQVYRPKAEPRAVVLFLSGDGGWHLGVVRMAHAFVEEGALVAGIDIRHYLRALGEAKGGACQYLAVDFEELSHRLQKQFGLVQYRQPIMVGYSSGATVVYAVLAQSPPGTFAGAISLGFCPDQDMKGAALCAGSGLKYSPNKKGDLVFEPAGHLKDPWIAVQGQQDQVCKPQTVDTFVAATANAEVVRLPKVGHGFGVERNWMPQLREAYRSLAQRAVPPKSENTEVSDLPLVEVLPENFSPARPAGSNEAFALMISGDGGWAGIDREVSAELAAQAMPVVGLNSLRYFWSARTPEQTAADVARVIEHYSQAWSRPRVLLVGYSFGADVMPFVVSRLPPALRARIAGITLIGLSDSADFEIHVSGWLPGVKQDGSPVMPELARLDLSRVLCLYGAGEDDSQCPAVARAGGRAVQIGSGHHLGGRYSEVARKILELPAQGG